MSEPPVLVRSLTNPHLVLYPHSFPGSSITTPHTSRHCSSLNFPFLSSFRPPNPHPCPTITTPFFPHLLQHRPFPSKQSSLFYHHHILVMDVNWAKPSLLQGVGTQSHAVLPPISSYGSDIIHFPSPTSSSRQAVVQTHTFIPTLPT